MDRHGAVEADFEDAEDGCAARHAALHGQLVRAWTIDGEIFVYYKFGASERDRLSIKRGGELNRIPGVGCGNWYRAASPLGYQP